LDLLHFRIKEINNLLDTSGDEASALRLADELVRQYPHEMRAWLLRSHIHARMKAHVNAVNDITQAMEVSPIEEPCLFFDRGRYYIKLRNFQDAINDCTQGLKVCDMYQSEYYRESLHFFRACAYVQLGRKDEALADLSKVRSGYQLWVDRLVSKEMLLKECERMTSVLAKPP
jgi:tetratricopeptide (TPR) repeat protein